MSCSNLRLPLFFAAVFSLAACEPPPPGPSADGVDLRGSSLGLDFQLTDDNGKPAAWNDYDGQYRLVYFGYAYCPDVCPVDLQHISQGLEQFEQSEPELGTKIQPIFITIDPERDTVEVVHEFVSNFHPRLVGLTGTPEVIAEITRPLGVYAKKQEPGESGGYLVDHTNLIYLFGPEGQPLGTLPGDKGADAIAAELQGWVR